jgi:DNA ligase D-like protein (predicted 3'-phosphoesterase)
LLKKYASKRNFSKTPEPTGEKQESGRDKIFVIQKHSASNLHYDFRLEINGVLVSWVVPKGPSTDPSERRLALPTEDHPLEYANFEGVIPEDEYGAGTVMVWDNGYYRNLMAEKDDDGVTMKQAYDDGKIEVWLKGEKVKGGYVLIRTDSGSNERWLLIKMDDQEADARRNPTSTENKSVLSGRTLQEIEGDKTAE